MKTKISYIILLAGIFSLAVFWAISGIMDVNSAALLSKKTLLLGVLVVYFFFLASNEFYMTEKNILSVYGYKVETKNSISYETSRIFWEKSLNKIIHGISFFTPILLGVWYFINSYPDVLGKVTKNIYILDYTNTLIIKNIWLIPFWAFAIEVALFLSILTFKYKKEDTKARW